MKNRILNKLLIASICASVLLTSNIPVQAAEISENIEETVDVETTTEDGSDVLSDENTEEILDENSKVNSEENLEDVTDEAPADTSADDAVTVNGQVYSGKVSVKLNFLTDGKSSLTAGTKFLVTFTNRHKLPNDPEYKYEVSVISKSINDGIETILPVGEYDVVTTSSLNGQSSQARLIFHSQEESSTVIVYEDDQVLDFTVEGDVKTNIGAEEVKEEEPEKENFLLSLLKNNIIFLVLLLGCGIALLVYRLKQDNQ